VARAHRPDPARLEDVPVHLDHLFALLDGYESVRRLSDEEAAALLPMTALCHAEFALSEADYFQRRAAFTGECADVYEGYLVGHARWFRGAGGDKLLMRLRRWAEGRSRGSARIEP
jgi:Ser/Thr protein kinase RdoA (MazF antagonist)